MPAPARSIALWPRYAWSLPTTLLGLGLVLIALATGGRVRRVGGILEAHGGVLTALLRSIPFIHGGALALALGHVVLGQTAEALDSCRQHELVHVRQAERWGPLFLPAYLVASLLARARTGRMYEDNCFEVEARRLAARGSTGC